MLVSGCRHSTGMCASPNVPSAVLLCVLARCEDDLTHKLVEIIRANITLNRMQTNGSPQHILNEYVSLLQVSRQGLGAGHLVMGAGPSRSVRVSQGSGCADSAVAAPTWTAVCVSGWELRVTQAVITGCSSVMLSVVLPVCSSM